MPIQTPDSLKAEMARLLEGRKNGTIHDSTFVRRAQAIEGMLEGIPISVAEHNRKIVEENEPNPIDTGNFPIARAGRLAAELLTPFTATAATAVGSPYAEDKLEAIDLAKTLARGTKSLITLGANRTLYEPNRNTDGIDWQGILEPLGAAGAGAGVVGLSKVAGKWVTKLSAKEAAKRAGKEAAKTASKVTVRTATDAAMTHTEDLVRYGRTGESVVYDAFQDPSGLLKASLDHELPPVVKPATPEGFPEPAGKLVSEVMDDLVSKGTPKKEAALEAIARATGRTMGLSKREIGNFRKYINLDQLPRATRRGWLRLADEVKREGLHEQALTLAQSIKTAPRGISDKAFVSLVMKKMDLADQLEAGIKEASDLIDNRKSPEARVVNDFNDVLRTQIDGIDQAATLSGTETARALSVRNVMLSRDTWDVVSVVRQAKVNKGEVLSLEEKSRFSKMTTRLDNMKKQLADMDIKLEQSNGERERLAAEAVVRGAAVKTRVAFKKSEIAAKRADAKDKLKALGFRVNDISGLSIEGSYQVGRIALSYIEEGVYDLAQVVKRVIKDVPEIEARDVWQGLNAKNPNAAARTETQIAIRNIKHEASILDQLEGVVKGEVRPVKTMETDWPDNIKVLKEKLDDLKAVYAKREFNPHRLEVVDAKIIKIQAQLEGGFRAMKNKAEAAELPDNFIQARADLVDLRKEMGLKDKLQVLNEQIRAGDVPEKKPRIKTPESEAVERQRFEIRRQQKRIAQAVHDMRKKTVGTFTAEAANTIRAVKTTADLGTTLRQNLLLSTMRPKEAGKALFRSIGAAFNEEYALRLDEGLRKQPENYYRERAGLFLPEVDEITLTPREEHFQKSWAEKLFFVRASKRQFITATNQLRAAAFDEILKVPNATRDEMDMWASFVNHASGRGDLGAFTQAANILSLGLFAPRFAVSRFQAVTDILKYRKNPLVRKMILKEWGATVAMGSTALFLASMNDDVEVSLDPRSPDWGKIKVGNTRYDIWGGFQQSARLVLQLGLTATDSVKLTGGKTTQKDPFSLAERFMEFKAAPILSSGRQFITGKDAVGNKKSKMETLVELPIPIVATDIKDAIMENGITESIPAAVLSLMGGGVTTYRKKVTAVPFRR